MQGDLLVAVDMDRKTSNGNGKLGSSGSRSSLNASQADRSKGDSNTRDFFPKNPKKNKPLPQKGRASQDKRPQSRSYGGSTETYRGKAADEAESTYSAFCDQKKQKKVNLNHLLNFTYNTAGVAPASNNFSGPPRGKLPKQRGFHLPRYNKELYLQATCQFVLKASGNYAVHNIDPDQAVEWDLVEQVRLRSPHVPNCPICLYPPTGAKIAKCGHVFCYACILHYLALSDKPWRKCPICYDAVDRKNLKSLSVVGLHEYKLGHEIELRLMCRERNLTSIAPVDDDISRKQYIASVDSAPPSISSEGPEQVYAKVLIATSEEVLDKIVGPEEAELKYQLTKDEEQPEALFIEQALELVAIRKESLGLGEAAGGELNAPAPDEGPEADSAVDEGVLVTSGSSSNIEAIVYESAFHDIVAVQAPAVEGLEKEGEEAGNGAMERDRKISECSSGLDSNPEGFVVPDDLDISALDLEPPEKGPEVEQGKGGQYQGGARPKTPKSKFYFYQSADGQPIYLHALNIKMLAAEYGSLEKCPRIISGKIIELEPTTMTPDLRDRLRYLQHLPVTTAFQVAEIRLTAAEPNTKNLISKETFRMFRDDVEERRRRRARRFRTEQRRERKICERERERMSYAPPGFAATRESITEEFDFNADFAPLPSAESPGALAEAMVAPAAAPGSGPMSFARMLKEGKQGPPRTIQSPRALASGTSEARRPQNNGSDNEDPDLPAPAFRQSMGDAIAQALEKADLKKKKEQNGETTGDQVTGSGKKKNKKKGVVLFQTSMARGSKP